MSAWYRPIPALALGLNFGAIGTLDPLDGANLSQSTLIDHANFFEAFADGRIAPASIVGLFGRVSVGAARVNVVPPFLENTVHQFDRFEPVLELQAGPELRGFLAPETRRARPDLFMRLLVTETVMPVATFPGIGVSMGFED